MRHLRTFRYIDAIARAGSIRGAADSLAITPSALNRRLLAFEDDLGVPIFERLANGVRLSTAGEILIHHVRTQLADMEKVHSRIADLSGMRRGHVSIACSEAAFSRFLPAEVRRYGDAHPQVTFAAHLRDRTVAVSALADHSADLAIVFEPAPSIDFHSLLAVAQPVRVLMAESHPLAGRKTVRLGECGQYPLALATGRHGVRRLLDAAAVRSSMPLVPAIESDSFEFLCGCLPGSERLAFQLPVALDPPSGDEPSVRTSGTASIALDVRDVQPGWLHVGQLRGRTLPVAAARFADQVVDSLNARYGEPASAGQTKPPMASS